jgi:prepilin-type N-terminal cleavage/methylation domain-containing protein
MLNHYFNHPMSANNGFSLVELLIGLLLGSLLILMVIGLYVTSVSTGSKILKNSRLKTDLQSMVTMLETDIRRAGYSGGEQGYLVGENGDKTIDINSDHNCIVYYYNHNKSSSVESSNKMAFSLRENTLKFKTGVEAVADTVCSATSGWINVSDAAFIKINKLSFTEELSSSAEATVRSVRIELAGELVSDGRYNHSITTAVQVRNIEFVD